MNCEICNKPITGKRSDSRYCSSACKNKAYHMRGTENDTDEFEEIYSDEEIFQAQSRPFNSMEELRKVEREHFSTILDLKSDYGTQIRALEDKNLRQDFTIERLKDKLVDLKEKYSIDIAKANTNSTKETVSAFSQMPAIQTLLGSFANNLIPSKKNALNGIENEFNVQEKQIIDSIRRMQADVQADLVQLLYVLFAKTHEEQKEIFSGLKAYMMPVDENEEIDV